MRMTLKFVIRLLVSRKRNNLQNDFDLICKWFDINKIYIHPKKIMVTSFGSKRKLVNKILSFKLNDINLQCVNNIKYLGVILDSQLTWSDHIIYIGKKISRSIGCNFVGLNTYTLQNSSKPIFCTTFITHQLLLYCMGKLFKDQLNETTKITK